MTRALGGGLSEPVARLRVAFAARGLSVLDELLVPGSEADRPSRSVRLEVARRGGGEGRRVAVLVGVPPGRPEVPSSAVGEVVGGYEYRLSGEGAYDELVVDARGVLVYGEHFDAPSNASLRSLWSAVDGGSRAGLLDRVGAEGFADARDRLLADLGDGAVAHRVLTALRGEDPYRHRAEAVATLLADLEAGAPPVWAVRRYEEVVRE